MVDMREVYFVAEDRGILDAVTGIGKGSVSSWICLGCGAIGLFSDDYQALGHARTEVA
jgi:hypothetical protein